MAAEGCVVIRYLIRKEHVLERETERPLCYSRQKNPHGSETRGHSSRHAHSHSGFSRRRTRPCRRRRHPRLPGPWLTGSALGKHRIHVRTDSQGLFTPRCRWVAVRACCLPSLQGEKPFRPSSTIPGSWRAPGIPALPLIPWQRDHPHI